MTAIGSRSGRDRTWGRCRGQLTVGITLVTICSLAGVAQAGGKQKFCSTTARTLFAACKAGVAGDALVRKAVCINVSDAAQQAECRAQAKADQDEARQLCQDQRDTRLATCEVLGEGRYDPEIDPGLFDDPRNPTKPNPYFPLAVGNRWEYRAGNEIDVVEIVDETKLIGGVRCIVVPPDLAALFCAAGNCVVTKNFSLLEPGIFARKYYAPGIGVFLEVEPDEAKAIRLVSCNFDPRCAMLTP